MLTGCFFIFVRYLRSRFERAIEVSQDFTCPDLPRFDNHKLKQLGFRGILNVDRGTDEGPIAGSEAVPTGKLMRATGGELESTGSLEAMVACRG